MFDLTPLYRSTIGFDRLAHMLEAASGFEASSYPPYDIERLGDDDYRITMAVAGFSPDDIMLEVKGDTLSVSSRKTAGNGGEREFLHQGIAARAFERRFQLADYVEVQGAEMGNGLLHIDLHRLIPEAMKPRTIAIKSSTERTKILEAKKAA